MNGASSPAAARAFDELGAALAMSGVVPGRMMGRAMLSVGGRMIACLDSDAVGFRLGSATPVHAAALAEPGAALFSPGGSGRQFRDWVAIPVSRAEEWERFALAAIGFVTGRRAVE